VADVGVIAWLSFGVANVLHDLVLALSWHFVARQDDEDVAPVGVFRYLFVNEVLELERKTSHKRCACRIESAHTAAPEMTWTMAYQA